MGIRVQAGKSVSAPEYLGRVLSSTDVQQLEAALGDGIVHAYCRVWTNAARTMDVGSARIA
jgi:hypothetical protein